MPFGTTGGSKERVKMLWSTELMAPPPSAPILGHSTRSPVLQWADLAFGTERADGPLPSRHQTVILQDLDGILLGQGAKVLDGALPLQPVDPWCLRATSDARCGHPRLALGDFGRWLLSHLLLQDHSSFAFLFGRKPLRGLLLGCFPLYSSSTAKS